MSLRRAVITGLGVVAPNGVGTAPFWQANLQGQSGIRAVSTFDTSDFDSKVAGEIQEFNPPDHIPGPVAKRTDRFVHLGLASSQMALRDSQLDLTRIDPARVGVIVGSGLGGVLFHEEQILAGYEKGAHRLSPACVPRITPNAVSSHIAIHHQLLGPNMVISTACASGAMAVGEAFRKIQHGETDLCLCGGVEAPLTRFTFGSYCALRVLSKKHNHSPQEASRPFDRERDGFVIAEAGAMLVLEELQHALDRNARIYAEIIAYSASSGAYHMVIPQPEGKDAAAVMAAALRQAELSPSDVGYINAHGTSTEANDRAETRAIKEVFGPAAYQIPVSSTKSMIGHTIGAAGAVEALVCALVLNQQTIPPTINYRHPDPECDLDYVPNQARTAQVRTALSNSFGFGSCNACLVFSTARL